MAVRVDCGRWEIFLNLLPSVGLTDAAFLNKIHQASPRDIKFPRNRRLRNTVTQEFFDLALFSIKFVLSKCPHRADESKFESLVRREDRQESEIILYGTCSERTILLLVKNVKQPVHGSEIKATRLAKIQ
jgi:hypothetical protein